MANVSTREACGRLLRGRPWSCLGAYPRRRGPIAFLDSRRPFSQSSGLAPGSAAAAVPLRKQLKEEAKARKAAGLPKKPERRQTVDGWELTVGIEIHAQLNTERKLFSGAAATTTSLESVPNAHVAYFDASLPGAQPVFQAETLIPAIRAALALNCGIERESRFDRKHYFHWDQPSGYQITQYYAPLARGGHITLRAQDGIAAEDGEAVRIDIVQVQMEQDTAKTVAQPGGGHWVDLNRAGAALVEIITAPQIHHPATAAALVRKVQLLLQAVDACTAGMEAGGLRADVNVSVRRTDDPAAPLGTRTEIKNLNSFRAVEDAIVAERARQIRVLESGGVVTGETRGWAPGQHGGETHRLRGKEGEVDYRYMPDPDLGPVLVDDGLVAFLQQTMGTLPDAELAMLTAGYGLAPQDAMALVLMESGGRAQFYYDVVDAFEARLGAHVNVDADVDADTRHRRAFVANWVLHQLGRLTSERNSSGSLGEGSSAALEMTAAGRCRIPVDALADILAFRYQGRISASVAKDLLFAVYRGEVGSDESAEFADVADMVERCGLWFDEITADEYRALAEQALEGEAKTLRLFVAPKRYPQGKLQYLLGKLLRLGPEGRTDPQHAEAAMRRAIEEHVQQGQKPRGSG